MSFFAVLLDPAFPFPKPYNTEDIFHQVSHLENIGNCMVLEKSFTTTIFLWFSIDASLLYQPSVLCGG